MGGLALRHALVGLGGGVVGIRYVQFIAPVQAWKHGGITHYSIDKHGPTQSMSPIEVVERGAWIDLFLVEVTKHAPEGDAPPRIDLKRLERVRVPMTNVAYIRDDGDDGKRGKA